MKQHHILVVDDQLVNIKILTAMLAKEGYRISQASRGPEALEKVEMEMPDLILLDVMMPEMDGFEVCRRIKDSEKTRSIPVLMVTALQELSHRQQAMEAGADDFLTKPVERLELIIRVKSLLRIKSYSDELLLSNQRLQEKNKQLSELEKAKEGLTYMIVHDLRGPLTSISMNLDLCLLKSSPADPFRRYLENSRHYCDYLDDMIQGLLDVYRMEQGALKPNLKESSMEKLVTEAIEQYRVHTESKKIDILLENGFGSRPVTMDPALIKRVVANLLDNAVRHTPEGETIMVSLDEGCGGQCIKTAIIDRGPGLDEESRQRVFDKFEQVKMKKKGQSAGSSGLGLTFCRLAVELHNGRIWVEDGRDHTGCSFVFELPIHGPKSSRMEEG